MAKIDPQTQERLDQVMKEISAALEEFSVSVKGAEVAMEEFITKYRVGDYFIRNYSGINHLCVLLSRDFDKVVHNRYVWKSTMLPLYGKEMHGGGLAEYYEEDIDNYKIIGNLSDIIDRVTERVVAE